MRGQKSFFLLNVLCAAAFVFGLATDAASQTSTGTVLGVVTDQSGAAITSADVALQSTTTGLKRTGQSLEGGNFQFLFVPPDVYQLTVSKAGFSTSIFNNIVVRVNETYNQSVQMKVGAVSQQVTVTAQVAKVDTSTASLGSVVNEQAVQEIPLNGRHFGPPLDQFHDKLSGLYGSFGSSIGTSRVYACLAPSMRQSKNAPAG